MDLLINSGVELTLCLLLVIVCCWVFHNFIILCYISFCAKCLKMLYLLQRLPKNRMIRVHSLTNYKNISWKKKKNLQKNKDLVSLQKVNNFNKDDRFVFRVYRKDAVLCTHTYTHNDLLAVCFQVIRLNVLTMRKPNFWNSSAWNKRS